MPLNSREKADAIMQLLRATRADRRVMPPGLTARQELEYILTLVDELPGRAKRNEARHPFAGALGSVFALYYHLGLGFEAVKLPPPGDDIRAAARQFLDCARRLWTPAGASAIARLEFESAPEVEFLYAMPILYHMCVAPDIGAVEYRGLTVRSSPFNLYDVITSLETAADITTLPSSPELNFLLDSRPDYPVSAQIISEYLKNKDRITDQWAVRMSGLTDEHDPKELEALSRQFADNLIAEAAAANRAPLCGNYILTTPDDIRAKIGAETFRLCIRPDGIWFSLWFSENPPIFKFMYWSPEWGRAFVGLDELPQPMYLTHLILAGIWRDSVVVRQAALRPHADSAGQPRPPGHYRPKRGQPVIMLPRTVYETTWATPDDLARIEDKTTRAPHGVRAHYRRLPDGWQRSIAALQAAEELDYPPPPDGFTFVRPHITDGGATSAAPRIVCRGLQTTLTVFSRLSRGAK